MTPIRKITINNVLIVTIIINMIIMLKLGNHSIPPAASINKFPRLQEPEDAELQNTIMSQSRLGLCLHFMHIV